MLTAEQIEQRKNHIGASDMAAILGLSKYQSAYDIWLTKTGQYEEPAEAFGGPMHIGNRCEPMILDEAEDHLGPLERNIVCPAPDGLPISARLDARLLTTHEPVEAKTAGMKGPLSLDWGDEGTDEIPEMYIVQLQVQMLCANANMSHLVAFLGGRGFTFYRVERNRPLCDIIVDRAVQFWQHVTDQTPPPDTMPSLEIISRIHRVPEKTINIEPALLVDWLTAKEMKKRAEEAEGLAKATLLVAMGDAEAATCGEVGGLSFFSQSRGSLDTARMKAEQPDIYRQYSKTSTFRVLRHKKPKAGRKESQ